MSYANQMEISHVVGMNATKFFKNILSACFKDVLFPRTNPFWLAYGDIVAMLRDLEPAHPLFAMFWHFAPEPESGVHMELLGMARQMLCSTTSQLLCSE